MQKLQAMNENQRWLSGWRPAVLGTAIGLGGFFLVNRFRPAITPSRVTIMAVGFVGIGVSLSLMLLWWRVSLDANAKRRGILRGLMGIAGGVGFVAWATGVQWLVWIAGAATLVLMRTANMHLNK